MQKVALLLGSNQGDRKELLSKARQEINNRIGHIEAQSSLHTTTAWGYQSENKYLNQALIVCSAQDPHQILDSIQQIEQHLGRKRSTTERYTDRTIDIDIIFYGDQIINTERLKIPHPLMAERDFVLKPLNELIPEFRHPILEISVNEISESIKI